MICKLSESNSTGSSKEEGGFGWWWGQNSSIVLNIFNQMLKFLRVEIQAPHFSWGCVHFKLINLPLSICDQHNLKFRAGKLMNLPNFICFNRLWSCELVPRTLLSLNFVFPSPNFDYAWQKNTLFSKLQNFAASTIPEVVSMEVSRQGKPAGAWQQPAPCVWAKFGPKRCLGFKLNCKTGPKFRCN